MKRKLSSFLVVLVLLSALAVQAQSATQYSFSVAGKKICVTLRDKDKPIVKVNGKTYNYEEQKIRDDMYLGVLENGKVLDFDIPSRKAYLQFFVTKVSVPNPKPSKTMKVRYLGKQKIFVDVYKSKEQNKVIYTFIAHLLRNGQKYEFTQEVDKDQMPKEFKEAVQSFKVREVK